MARGERDAWLRSPRGHFPILLTAQLSVTGLALSLQAMGSQFGHGSVTPAACALLLLFGLPHGTLDLELLRRRDGTGPGLIVLILAYVAGGAAMYALWQTLPLLALGAFLVMAVEHFAEDWRGLDAPFIAYGTAVAMIAMPALLHRSELASIFVVLTGASAAASLGDILLMLAPVAGIIAVAGTALLWQQRQRHRAIGLAGALLAEALLPPVVGFALFFCFVHSPYQLRDAIRQLERPAGGVWLRTILPLTLLAVLLAASIGTAALPVSLDAAAWRACFVTLSVLTLPHMLIPFLARHDRARRAVRRIALQPA